MKSIPLVITLLVLFSSTALADSVLRIQCTTDAAGARVFINGEFRGNCPADLFLSPGETTLRVVKPVDDERERIYETTLQLADQSARRINVELSQPQLTAEARQERERARQERARQAANLARKKAEQGDTAAMRELAGYYRNGKGVPEDTEKAKELTSRAGELDAQRLARRTLKKAQEGNVSAMQRMSDLYKAGAGIPQDTEKAAEWEARADNMIAEREKREQERERRAAERERNESLQEAIDNTAFLEYTRLRTSDHFNKVADPFGFLVALTFSPFAAGSGLVSDALLAPTKSTDVALWKSRMTSRPAAFKNPDSIIAHAYADQRPGSE